MGHRLKALLPLITFLGMLPQQVSAVAYEITGTAFCFYDAEQHGGFGRNCAQFAADTGFATTPSVVKGAYTIQFSAPAASVPATSAQPYFGAMTLHMGTLFQTGAVSLEMGPSFDCLGGGSGDRIGITADTHAGYGSYMRFANCLTTGGHTLSPYTLAALADANLAEFPSYSSVFGGGTPWGISGNGWRSYTQDARLRRVPEPGTLALLGLGLVGLGLSRRRKAA